MHHGDRMLLWCTGGPSVARAVVFPPPIEIEVDGGVYVLDETDAPEQWRYEFVANDHRT